MIRLLTRSIEDSGPDYSVVMTPVGTAGSSTSGTWGQMDVVDTALSASSPTYRLQLRLDDLDSLVANLTPGVVNISQFPVVTRNAEGCGLITLDNGRRKRLVPLSFADLSGGQVTRSLTGPTAGTYAEFSEDIINALMAAGGDLNLFSVTTPGAWAYNGDCWASSFDFTGVPAGHGNGRAFNRGGALITRRHLICAHHYQAEVGETIEFVKANGTIVSYTIQARFNYSDSLIVDKQIYLLSSDVDPDIADYQIAGPWAQPRVSYGNDAVTGIVAYNLFNQGTGVWLDQFRNVYRCSGMSPSYTWSIGLASGSIDGDSFTDKVLGAYVDGTLPAYLSAYSSFTKTAVDGDSGSPCFLPLGAGELCFHACIVRPWSGSWPDEELLNAMISYVDGLAGISTGYTVAVAPDPTP